MSNLPNDFYDLSTPVLVDGSGLYMTVAQMRYWLTKENGKKLFSTGSNIFNDYYNSCRAYNLISDLLDEDPSCAYLYWDSTKGCPVFSFSKTGLVSKALIRFGLMQ